ncbi:nitroreductase [Roseovarius spongiae]|uniref:Putative NAD(P)H nitroreductase n=1 Tax=Roseovarius spongiae TaxID=2320272 RepID=A0A3A8B475_9RHOB|nr:nitroreductase family protein [Roseovarius spongiae]RKF16421.1 nitroreductase [Roseovarius spongiae]
MSEPNPAALEFLQTRRSRPAKMLGLPVPDRDALMPLLTAAARSPDHGKLEPWRFVVLERGALQRMAGLVAERGAALGRSAEDIEKLQAQYEGSHLAVAVIEVQKPSEKIPAIEQSYSAAAVCLGLLNAALAAGWGANWLTGWASHDPAFAAAAVGAGEGERIAGVIHIGTERRVPPDRPRPDVEALTTWLAE